MTDKDRFVNINGDILDRKNKVFLEHASPDDWLIVPRCLADIYKQLLGSDSNDQTRTN